MRAHSPTPGLAVHTFCQPITQEAKAELLGVQLHSGFKARLSYNVKQTTETQTLPNSFNSWIGLSSL